MKSTNELREEFLSFFEKEHQSTRVESSSLVPDNPTILLTTAGMVQFIPYFLGYQKPPFSPARAVTCQKCARAGGKDSDIENVGRTPRHHTFFEMLGNFSFGDYFKEEIIPWSWEFVTNRLKLDKDRLWITIYKDDDEAFKIWNEVVGVPKERILRKGKKDNFWGPVGTSGPCGPCSEIHYDLGADLKCSDDCSIDTCECNRWVEIWNLVFTELFQDEKGNLTPLEKKNVDTGMGLERIAMVCQGVQSTFDTDSLKTILNEVCFMTKKEYKKDEKTDVSLRIITDHARCVTFMISDGIYPSNEGRGYVLRMILRRALRHGKILGLELPFLYNLIDKVIEIYKDAYPELKQNADKIKKTIKTEEEKFKQTLGKGQTLIEDVLKRSEKTISGEDAFKLYDTFGYPLELTKEIAGEYGLAVDEEGFKKCMEEQKKRAKASVQKVNLTDDLIYIKQEQKFGPTKFIGYEQDCADAKVLAIICDGKEENCACENQKVDLILDVTPFYAQSGGQVGDSGTISAISNNVTFEADVTDTFKTGKTFVHRVEIKKGNLKIGDTVKAEIDTQRRKQIASHHTSAHLLQAALIQVLGDEVKQAGSQVEQNRARYDFSFSRAMTKEEIEKTETLINKWIDQGISGSTDVMDIELAKKSGAIALFGEKYDDKVRVVSYGNISKELCGGTHCKTTKDLRLAKIVSESAISAGSRRIEILTNQSAFDYLNEKAFEIDKISQKYKLPHNEIENKIEKLIEENKQLSSKISALEVQSVKNSFNTFLSRAKEIMGGKLFISKIEEYPPNAIKAGMEMFAKKLGESIIVLACAKSDNTVFVVAKVTDGFIKKGVNAGALVSKITKALGGNGGGKPQFAQGAGKTKNGLDEILLEVEASLLNI